MLNSSLSNDLRRSFEPGRPVIVLSPHPDDAAFSVGGMLTQLCRISPVTVCTVFSRSEWYYHLPPGTYDEAEVTRIRAEEDRAYCRAIGASYEALGLSDASLRGHTAVSELRRPSSDDPAWEAARCTLAELVRLRSDAVFFIPSGIGGHVDHIVVRDVASAALLEGTDALFYEDLPYACQAGPGTVNRWLSGYRARPTAFCVGGEEMARKVELLEGYQSQIEPGQLEAVRRYGRERSPAGAEVLWSPPPRAIASVARWDLSETGTVAVTAEA